MVEFTSVMKPPIEKDDRTPEYAYKFDESIKWANRLNEEFGKKSCFCEMKDITTKVNIDLSKSENQYEVVTYCCNSFRQKIEKLNQNQHPFPEDI